MRVYIVVCYEQICDFITESERYEVLEVQAFDTVDKAIAYGKNGKWDDYQIFERNVT